MNCHLVVNLSSDYIDEELPLKERREVEAHIKDCPSCRTVYEDLQKIVSEAKSLPVVEPSERLWLKLKDRVREEAAVKQGGPRPINFLKQLIGSWPSHKRLVAASSALIFIIALALYWTWRPWVKERSTEDTALAEIQQAEIHYQKAIYSLDQIVTSRKSSWDPQFAEVFESNLRKIDQAIAECQEAVKKYPRDPEAAKFLLAAYSQKVDFLQEILQIRS